VEFAAGVAPVSPSTKFNQYWDGSLYAPSEVLGNNTVSSQQVTEYDASIIQL
jgi:hypothetical protein